MKNRRSFILITKRLHQKCLNTFVRVSCRYGETPWVLFSAFIIFLYLMLCVRYLLSGSFIDHLEPTVASIAWIHVQGGPIYHDLDALERYSLPYGPMVFIINGFFMKLLGADLVTSKMAGVAAAIFGLIFFFLAVKCKTDTKRAIIYTGLMTACLSVFHLSSFWNRPDSFIVLFVSTALFAVSIKSRCLSSMVLAVAIGTALNLKITSLFYFFPIIYLYYRRVGWKDVFVVALFSVTVLMCPFLIYPHISAHNYIQHVLLNSKHGIDPLIMLLNGAYIAVFLCPAMSFLFPLTKGSKAILVSFIMGLFPIFMIASKAGAGYHHLMPFVPVFLYLISISCEGKSALSVMTSISTRADRTSNKRLLLYIPLIVLSLHNVVHFIDTMERFSDMSRTIALDIRSIENRFHDQRLHMGYGMIDTSIAMDYFPAWFRPLLIFAGHPCYIDSGSLMDYEKAGRKITDRQIDVLRNGSVDIWLFPRGVRPFVMQNWYKPHNDLFDDEYRQVFREKYEFLESTRYYDLWVMKGRR
jgi:hypothetical protein